MSIIRLSDVRATFPVLTDPKAIGDGERAWGIRFPINPNGAHVAAIEKAMLDTAIAKWKDNGAEVLEGLKEDRKVCFERRPYKNKEGKVYAGFEGMFNLGSRTPESKPRPTVFDQFNKKIGDPDRDLTPQEKNRIESLIYSGCYVHAKVEFWAQDNPQYGRRVNCSLLGVMFSRDGESFGGGARPAGDDDFADMAKEPMSDADDSLV